MENLLILYYIVAIALGMFSLGCFFTIQKNNKNEIIRSFLACYGLFCMFILTTAAQTYLDLTEQQNGILRLIVFALQFLSIFSFLLILTFLINKIHLVPFIKRANIILSVLTAAVWIFTLLRDSGVHPFFSLPYLNVIDDELVYIVVILYNAGIYYFYRKNVENLKLYKVLRVTFLIVLLCVPGFILDEYLSAQGSSLLFTPFFFMVISIFSLVSFFKYHESTQNEKYEITDGLKEKMGITERETDVVKLLLKGYSYQKIADELVISLSTVRAHVSSIYRKAGINSRFELYNKIQRPD
jgi:DNA-binding CsgD family transcriptional regulator